MKPEEGSSTEWDLLELLCTGIEDEAGEERLQVLLTSPDLDWAELLDQALRHQMLPLLAYHVLHSRARAAASYHILFHLASDLDLNRHRLRLARSEVARLARAFRERGLRFAATKGITFESTIYHAKGVRALKDIDLMIAPGDREAVLTAMEELGYQAGAFDWASGTIQPHARRDHMRYVLHQDHLPRLARLTADPCVRFLYVDIANSLTWSGGPYEVPVEEALATATSQEIPGIADVRLPCLAPNFQFLFTVLHLFREAWLDNWVDVGLDVTLAKFADVIRLFRRHWRELCAPEFVDLLETRGVTEPVLWVLEHLDRSFGLHTVRALGLEGRISESWLAAAHPSRGRSRAWTGDMRRRLQHKDRRTLFAEATS